MGKSLAEFGNRIWLIDTGIDLNHADLKINIIFGKNCIPYGRNTFDNDNGHKNFVTGL